MLNPVRVKIRFSFLTYFIPYFSLGTHTRVAGIFNALLSYMNLSFPVIRKWLVKNECMLQASVKLFLCLFVQSVQISKNNLLSCFIYYYIFLLWKVHPLLIFIWRINQRQIPNLKAHMMHVNWIVRHRCSGPAVKVVSMAASIIFFCLTVNLI